MPRSFDLYLQDMLQAGRAIEAYTADKTFEDYKSDQLLRLAIERLFEIIGEGLKQSREVYPGQQPVTAAQQQIIDFRNRVIHGYFNVNDQVVWSAAKVFLPPFVAEIEERIAQRTKPTK